MSHKKKDGVVIVGVDGRPCKCGWRILNDLEARVRVWLMSDYGARMDVQFDFDRGVYSMTDPAGLMRECAVPDGNVPGEVNVDGFHSVLREAAIACVHAGGRRRRTQRTLRCLLDEWQVVYGLDGDVDGG